MVTRDPLCGIPVEPEKVKFKAEVLGKVHYFCSEECMHRFLVNPRIAYFSMEVAIKSEIPTYSLSAGRDTLDKR